MKLYPALRESPIFADSPGLLRRFPLQFHHASRTRRFLLVTPPRRHGWGKPPITIREYYISAMN